MSEAQKKFKLYSGKSKMPGLSPGTIVHIGEPRTGSARVTIMDYDANGVREKEVKRVEECFPFKKKKSTTWINVDGVHDTRAIEAIGGHFGVHPLVLEDIANTRQRPKFEDFGDYLFIVVKMLRYDEKSHNAKVEQVSLIISKGFVISFQESRGDVFDPVRERIRKGGRTRRSGTDYLAYALLDAIVDEYFLMLEQMGERVEKLEKELVINPQPKTLNSIYQLKREMIFLRRSVWPLRELVSGFERCESPLVKKTTRVYLRDVYDHTVQVIDTVETYRDMLSGMIDLYLSSISNKMNEVMKVLTIIATIFIPLTFIAGVYGMNFKYMPELGMEVGYPAVIGVMALVAVVMLAYFKKKKWI